MLDKISPNEMFEFTKIYDIYKKNLSLTAQQALWYRDNFNHYVGMIEGLQKAGWDDESVVNHCVDFLSSVYVEDTEEGRKRARKYLNEGKEFYELVSNMNEPRDISTRADKKLGLLLQAYEEALFRISTGNLKTENLEARTVY